MRIHARFMTTVAMLIALCLLRAPHAEADDKTIAPDMEPEISLDFKDAAIKDVLKAFSIQAGMNFIAAGDLNERKLTLYLDKVPIEKALLKLFQANNLGYEFDRDANIFTVKELGRPNSELITRVFRLRYASVSSSSLKEEMKKNIAGGASQLTMQSGGASSASSGASSGGESGKWKMEEDAGITKAVRKLLSKDEKGKESGSVIEDFRTNSLIVTDYAVRMPVIAALIAELDQPIPQIMLEVEMLDVSKNLVDKMGFDWTGAGSFSMQVLSASRGTFFPLAGYAPAGAGKGTFSPGTVSFPTTLKVVLDYLRTQTDTKYLARPRILTLNSETAEIGITTNEVIGEDITFDQTTGRPVSATAERTQTGVSLRITPQIDPETGQIQMFLIPKVVEASASVFNSQIAGKSYRDPESRETKTLVRVKDGDTVIVGGLIRNQLTEIETKIPLLCDIPVVGALFRHKNRSKDLERELLVFITPHIVRNTAGAAPESERMILPDREQNSMSGLSARRSLAIDSALNKFEDGR